MTGKAFDVVNGDGESSSSRRANGSNSKWMAMTRSVQDQAPQRVSNSKTPKSVPNTQFATGRVLRKLDIWCPGKVIRGGKRKWETKKSVSTGAGFKGSGNRYGPEFSLTSKP